MNQGNGDEAGLSELLARAEPDRTLPREFYTSSAVFERDLERIFFRQWNFVGHVSRIPHPGDYFLHQVGGESIIVIRDRDRSIRALANVCTHRGSRICLSESGHAAKLVCPYHAWCFDLDGSFLSGRHVAAEPAPGSRDLRRIAASVVEGLVFICLAPDPPDFGEVAEEIRAFFRPHRFDKAKICSRMNWSLRANWKITADNFLECYHCLPTHPELAQVMSYVRAFDSPSAAAERKAYTVRWEEEARRMGHVTGVKNRSDGLHLSICRIPIREGFLTQSRGGRPVAPLMGELRAYDGGVTATQFYPLHWFVANNDYGMAVRFTPRETQLTDVEVTWLVREGAVEGRDYDPEEVTWLWRRTMEEDKKITEDNQAGVNSRFYRPGPHTSEEKSLTEFAAWYLEQIR